MNLNERGPTPEDPLDLAWQHYRNGDYDQAFEIAQKEGKTIKGLELLAHIYAYSKKYRDRDEIDPNKTNSVVSRLKERDPENILADNAVIIYEIERKRQGGE